VDGANLTAAKGKAIDLTARQINIENHATVKAEAGEVRLVARQGKGVASVTPDTNWHLRLPGEMPRKNSAGDITVRASTLDSSGDGAGRVAVWGRDIAISGPGGGADGNPALAADNSGSSARKTGAGVWLSARSLSIDNAKISGGARGPGAAPGVNITARGDVTLSSDSRVVASTEGEGDGGKVAVRAGRDVSVTKSLVRASSYLVNGRDTRAKAGEVKVIAGRNVNVSDEGEISAHTETSGQGGKVTVVAVTGDVSLSNGSWVYTQTTEPGEGGEISVRAGRDVAVTRSWVQASFPEGNKSKQAGAGRDDVEVVAQRNVNVSDGGEISTYTKTMGDGGGVTVRAVTGNVSIDGKGAKNSEFTGIDSVTESRGNAGDVAVIAKDTVTIANGGSISTSVTPRKYFDRFAQSSVLGSTAVSKGKNTERQWGDIKITAGPLVSMANATITADVRGAYEGKPGNIQINSTALMMQSSAITANPRGGGEGGNIALNVQGLLIDGNNVILGGTDIKPLHYGVPGWNIVHAAEPDRLYLLSASVLNLHGILPGLGGPQFDTSSLSEQYCTLGEGSSLTRKGKGGLLPKGDDLLLY